MDIYYEIDTNESRKERQKETNRETNSLETNRKNPKGKLRDKNYRQLKEIDS